MPSSSRCFLCSCEANNQEDVYVTANGYTIKDINDGIISGNIYLTENSYFTLGDINNGYGLFNLHTVKKYNGNDECVLLPTHLDFSNRKDEYKDFACDIIGIRDYAFANNTTIKTLGYKDNSADTFYQCLVFYKAAMFGCTNLTTIVPDSDGKTRIRIYFSNFDIDNEVYNFNGKYAFYGTNLTAEDLLVYGGANAFTFANMTGLISKMTVFDNVYEHAFDGGSGKIKTLILKSSDNATSPYLIKSKAFNGANIDEIIFDFKNVVIEKDAFTDSNHLTVRFNGTKEELISILNDNNNLLEAGLKKIICSDEKVLVSSLYK